MDDRLTGGGMGLNCRAENRVATQTQLFYYAMLALAVSLCAAFLLDRSRSASACDASSRTRTRAASSAWIPTRYKTIAFALSGVFPAGRRRLCVLGELHRSGRGIRRSVS